MRDSNKPIALAVRRFRAERGITQQALAFKSGVTVAALSRIERGVVSSSLSSLFAIAGGLDLSVSDLVLAAEQVVAADQAIADAAASELPRIRVVASR